MRSPVAMSKGCAPVLASYSAITLFTSSMSAVAGSYSRMVVSPRGENVRILAFMFVLLPDIPFRFPVGSVQRGLGPPLLVILRHFPHLSRQRLRLVGADEDRVISYRPISNNAGISQGLFDFLSLVFKFSFCTLLLLALP